MEIVFFINSFFSYKLLAEFISSVRIELSPKKQKQHESSCPQAHVNSLNFQSNVLILNQLHDVTTTLFSKNKNETFKSPAENSRCWHWNFLCIRTIGKQIAIENAYDSAMFGNSWREKFVPVESEFTNAKKLQPIPIPIRIWKHQGPRRGPLLIRKPFYPHWK